MKILDFHKLLFSGDIIFIIKLRSLCNEKIRMADIIACNQNKENFNVKSK